MLALYDFFPTTRHQLRPVPIIPNAHHSMFPRIPIYNTGFVPKSPFVFIKLQACMLDTQTFGDYVIPTTSPLHHTHLYSERRHDASVTSGPTCQFGIIQVIGLGVEETILIRRGNCLVVFREVWKLVLVIFEWNTVQLFYRLETQAVMVLLRIIKDKVAEPEFMGKYQLVDMTPHL